MSSSKEKTFTSQSGKISKLSATDLKSSKKKSSAKEIASTDDSNRSDNRKSNISDIDSLFEGAKMKKKPENIEKKVKKAKKQVSLNDESAEDKPTRNQRGMIISPEAPLERIDAASGLPVYKAHLLKVGQGGGTDLCPFDCDCCF